MATNSNWVDFKSVKSLVTFPQVLEHYRVCLKGSGQQVRGPCPLPQHSSKDSRWSFNVNLEHDIWCCKSESCIAARNGKEGGNILDFVMFMEQKNIKEAAALIVKLFGTGSTSEPKQPKPELVKPHQGNNLPESVTSQMPYMRQIEHWWAELKVLRDKERSDEYEKRVLNGIKSRLLDSYRQGQKSKTATPK